ncbi:MAG: nuclease [Synechococcus sp.]|nr:nuclease [Synechococcus sp.]
MLRSLGAGLAAALLVLTLVMVAGVLPADAAEVLQVRTATVLQVGDGNRSYAVELACIQVEPAAAEAAQSWLRQELPRRSRVNLRPLGQREGLLLARVRLLGRSEDIGAGLIAAGLAEPDPEAPAGCPS